MEGRRAAVWGLILVAVVAVGWYRSSILADPAGPRTTRLAFVTGGSDPYWQLAVRGAQRAAEDHDVQLQMHVLSQAEGIAEQIKTLVGLLDAEESQLDGVAVSPLNPTTQTLLINRLAERYFVVTYDSDAPLSNRHCYIGTSNYYAGQTCARMVSEAIQGQGKVALFLANQTKNNMIERRQGFEEELKSLAAEEGVDGDSQIDVVQSLVDNGDPEQLKKNIREILSSTEGIDCLIGMNGYHGPLLVEVLDAEGMLGQVKVVAFDEAEATLGAIERGDIYATIAQDPYKFGYEAVQMVAALNNGKAVELPIFGASQMTVPCGAIRQQELPAFRKRLAERLQAQVAD